MSNNIGTTDLTDGQASPEVSVNNADHRIDSAVTETFTANLAAGNVVPTLAQIQQAMCILCSGVATSGRQVQLTNCTVKKFLIVDNPAASTNSVSIVKGTRSVPVHPGEVVAFYLDGTANFLQVLGFGKRSEVFFAKDLLPRTTAGSAALAAVELATNKVMVQSLDFDQITAEFAQFTWWPERAWDRGTVTAIFSWTAAAGAGDVIWTIAGLARTNDDPLDTAFGTAVSVTDTLLTTNDEHHTAETGAVTIAGTPIEDDRIIFQVSRDAAAGGDTLTADAKLLAVKLIYTVTSPSQR